MPQSHPPNVSRSVLGTGTGPRNFNAVLLAANQILKTTFGMELIEMQAMPSDKDMSEKDADLLKNTGVKKKGESCSSCPTSYMLTCKSIW